jgi:hypothetical protein
MTYIHLVLYTKIQAKMDVKRKATFSAFHILYAQINGNSG